MPFKAITDITIRDSDIDRFMRSLAEPDANGCRRWKKMHNSAGYGMFSLTVAGKRRHIGAHRYAYTRHHGQIPEGMEVCHTCDVRDCAEDSHLWLGTHRENHMDCGAKGRSARARLDADKVRAIREALRSGQKQQDVAHQFDVTQGTISQLHIGQSWGYIID